MKKALVTGGTRGIGWATALALRAAGFEVVVTGRSPGTQGPAGCGTLACDFSDRKATEAFAAEAAAMDFSVLVNNAAINQVGFVSDCDPNDFLKIQQVNVVAPFLLCRAVVPGMQKRKFGRIVNLSSIFGVVSRPGRAAYSTSKFALTGLTRALALEVAGDNVLVNAVAPGVIDTEMTRGILGEKGIAEILKKIPMGRLAQAEEIARVIRFLVSEENTYLTGQTIIVDGGYTIE